MKIKDYITFVNESKIYQYGCVMIDINVKNWNEITSFIKEEDIFVEEGLEKEPHLTLLYGLHSDVTEEQVIEKLKSFNEVNININGIDIFENEKCDVVKFNVDITEQLQSMHESLRELPHTTKYNDYKPHITIGYVKKGKGKKYIKSDYNYSFNSNKVVYSYTTKNKFKFNLNE